jgi:hypothetical protein
MKTFLFVTAIAVAATSHAQAAPAASLLKGNFVWKPVESTKTKLFVRVKSNVATARYSGDENTHTFQRAKSNAKAVTFRGANGYLTFLLPAHGVIRASGEIRGDLGRLICRRG